VKAHIVVRTAGSQVKSLEESFWSVSLVAALWIAGCCIAPGLYPLNNLIFELRIHNFIRRCQKEDWKLRHRNICGKLLTLEDAQTITVGRDEIQSSSNANIDQEMIGAAARDFTRSLDLKYTVHYVNALRTSHPESHVEYILFSASGEPRPVCLDDDCFRRIFRLYSNKAMTTGDRMAVATLGQYLISTAEQFDTTRSGILAQLNREYGIDVGGDVKELEESNLDFTKMEQEWQRIAMEDEGT
jgi:hypothetical protein